MATMKSSASTRVRGTPVKENGVKVEEGLNAFKSDKFDAEGYVQTKCSLNEKEIRQLCSYLQDLKKASAEEMRKSVYANYAAFIRTSKEISELEVELSSIRNLLSTQAALVHSLAEGVNIESLSISGSDGNGLVGSRDREQSELDKWFVEYPDLLDVLLAERRVDEALSALDEGERIAAEAKENKSLKADILASLQNIITERRQKLADQLAEAACQPSTRGKELRAAILALKKLGDGSRAHSLLLNAHYQRYQYNMQSLRPSSTSYGGAYTAALSQLVFSAIAQAACDSMAIFGQEPAYRSELVMWATKQTESFALIVKRHALASSAAAGGLRAAAECVQIALGHCSLLEARGLALCPILMKLFRPSVEQALEANLKRIEESTAALAAADDWVLMPPNNTRQSCRVSSASHGLAYQHKLSSSAHRFNAMVQDFFEDVGPLLSMQLGGQTLDGLFQVFNSYMNMLIKALPASMEEEGNFEGSANKIIRMAETEEQQLALLANASLLADELLPRAAMKLSPVSQANQKDDPRRRPAERQNRHPEQREWKRRLASSVDRLKDSFCRQHALDLIFTEEGDSNLTADMYINMNGHVDEIIWFPSPIFQELFLKLYRLANMAADMFVGRERFATLLLMRLTETVILWLSEDQSFWDDIYEGPRPLGPLGLQQFYLDMKFVLCFASQGRYLSRNLNRVVSDIISKAMEAFSATGIDPNSVLPQDDWFIEVSQEAIDRLSGKPKEINGDPDLGSPTASLSAQSISSFRSHGSSKQRRLHKSAMRAAQPSAGSVRSRRHRPDLTLPLPQRDASLALPLPLPPTNVKCKGGASSSISCSDLERKNRIGSGAGGTVYRVIHRPTNTTYALKVIHLIPEESVRRQICREIEILRDVCNPNVVKCHEMFDHSVEIQVLLEYMDGGSLEGAHVSNEASLADLTRQILSGVAYLHRQHIVHRDIKPSNLLINGRKQVKIADFGVSRILEQTMDLNSSVGTIAYMSPERINTDLNHGKYDGYAGDIWSLGVSVLEFYLGKFPFAVSRHGEWASLMVAICMRQPPEAPETASGEFRDFLSCCLRREPRKRWSAQELLGHPFIVGHSSHGMGRII